MKNNWILERETQTMESYSTGVHFQLSQRGTNRCINDSHISLGRYMLVHCHSLLGHLMKLGHH